jgi:ABC-type multidrug transport system ATPase subunit
MLTLEYKKKIYSYLIKPHYYYMNQDGFAVINKVWNLREMESTDARYKDAYGDFRQHIINNEDWELDDIFINRLNLLSGPEAQFIHFVESFIDPEIRKDIRFIEEHVQLINEALVGSVYKLMLVDYFENLPLYRLTNKIEVPDLPPYLIANKYVFYKTDEILTYPCFVLLHDNWDDFTYKTSVVIQFCASPAEREIIGATKIMSETMDKRVWEVLPDSFTELPATFCSFSRNEDYYFGLKNRFPTQYNSILHAVRDAGIFPRIAERFEDSNIFKRSLIRENEDEKLWREIRFKLAGISIRDAFRFRYDFKPPYADDGIDLDFNFIYGDDVEIEHRIYALIGKNGTGKTRILSGIAQELSHDHPNCIGPFKPLYSKIFTLSYSIFDRFDIQSGNSAFNYVYCGLKKNKNEHLTDAELRERLLRSATEIGNRSLTDHWHGVLRNFIHQDVLSMMFSNGGTFKFEPRDLNHALERLSSGQHILLYVLTEMLAQIRNDSLILYDEPETHLHPNAISELMNSILDLVERFKSFCIIATHSPLVVQSLQSRNVYIINREENVIELRLTDKESFGENLTVITEDIFGNKSVDKDYLLLLNDLKEKGHSYKDIIEMLELENGLPVNLNIRLQLKSLFKQ